MATTPTPNLGLTHGWQQGEAGWGDSMNTNLDLIDAAAFGSVLTFTGTDLQAAIDATIEGGLLELGPGTWTSTDPAGFHITKSITIRGKGHSGVHGSIIRPLQSGTTQNNVGIHITGDYVTLEGICVKNPTAPATTGTGYGIHAETHTGTLSYIVIRDCAVENSGGHGIYFDTAGSLGINSSRIENCNILTCNGIGIYAFGCTAMSVYGCFVHSSGEDGIKLDGCANPRLRGCYAEDNKHKLDVSEEYIYNAEITLVSCLGGAVTECGVEEFHLQSHCQQGILLNNCYGVVVEGNYFLNSSSEASSKSIVLRSSSRGLRIGPNVHRTVGYTLYAQEDDGIQGVIVEPQSITTYDATAQGLMSMPSTIPQHRAEDGTSHEGIFNLVYRSQTSLAGGIPAGYRIVGLQLPLLSGLGDAADCAYDGMLVYDASDHEMKYYNGTGWRSLTSSAE
jgi:hypothetical protein